MIHVTFKKEKMRNVLLLDRLGTSRQLFSPYFFKLNVCQPVDLLEAFARFLAKQQQQKIDYRNYALFFEGQKLPSCSPPLLRHPVPEAVMNAIE